MVVYTKDNALVAKYPPKADRQASNSTGGKGSSNVAMATKHPPRSGPARSRQQSIYQRGGQRANDGKASVRDPQMAKIGRASCRERVFEAV